VKPLPPALLLVEHDPARARAIADQLEGDGYAVAIARTAEHARVLARGRAPAVALIGGLEQPHAALRLLEEMRRARSREPWGIAMPAIVLDRRGRQLDLLRAFEAGADDFLGPRAGYLELRARLLALQRRAALRADPSDLIDVDGLRIDPSARVAELRGEQLTLRPLEFELLLHLAREPRRVFARRELLAAVWGYRAPAATRTVDSHASRLRRKLAGDDVQRWVINVWGVGYRLT
jgi:DNA-binding response OmpR family regulator